MERGHVYSMPKEGRTDMYALNPAALLHRPANVDFKGA
jgi:hypothetical protein